MKVSLGGIYMKKVLSVVIILAIIIFLSYVGTLPSNEKEENNKTNQNITTERVNEETNNVENEIDTNNRIENEIQNEIVNDDAQNKVENTVSSETFEESPKTSEEKAIDIAKKDWGNDNSVNFSVQGIDGNGNYIVVVSDSNTVSLAFYTVNVSNETFTKREMN